MPDLRGLSAREALRTLSQIGMTARMSGDGFVVEQSPDAGRRAGRSGDVCSLKLDRRPPRRPEARRNDAARRSSSVPASFDACTNCQGRRPR